MRCVRIDSAVIPGPSAARSPESIRRSPWLWIPGSPLARRPGMTAPKARNAGAQKAPLTSVPYFPIFLS